jgi:hypothetical protein
MSRHYKNRQPEDARASPPPSIGQCSARSRSFLPGQGLRSGSYMAANKQRGQTRSANSKCPRFQGNPVSPLRSRAGKVSQTDHRRAAYRCASAKAASAAEVLPIEVRSRARVFSAVTRCCGWRGRTRPGDTAGDLVAALVQHRLAVQAAPAAPAHGRGELQPLTGMIGERHRGARLARLLARSPLPPLPQRPVPRLLVRAVRRRRPRRRRGILARLPLQVFYPRLQPADQRRLLRAHPVRLGKQPCQLGMRQRGQLLRRGNTGHIGHSTQTCTTAGRQSTTGNGVSRRQKDSPPPPGTTP